VDNTNLDTAFVPTLNIIYCIFGGPWPLVSCSLASFRFPAIDKKPAQTPQRLHRTIRLQTNSRFSSPPIKGDQISHLALRQYPSTEKFEQSKLIRAFLKQFI
jgi:hypothetical protein